VSKGGVPPTLTDCGHGATPPQAHASTRVLGAQRPGQALHGGPLRLLQLVNRAFIKASFRLGVRWPAADTGGLTAGAVLAGRPLSLTLEQAREELREKVRATHDEGIPFAVIAQAAGLSRGRVRQLYAGR
jgi:hypothetical protein